jgi:hypothetical protein
MATKGREAALNLYRGILRAHNRHLPTEMRSLGDAYVKSEFKLHKSVSKTDQLDNFFVAWEQYLDQILQTARRKEAVSAGSLDEKSMASTGFGQHLPSEVELNDEQRGQLEKLKDETSRAGRPVN